VQCLKKILTGFVGAYLLSLTVLISLLNQSVITTALAQNDENDGTSGDITGSRCQRGSADNMTTCMNDSESSGNGKYNDDVNDDKNNNIDSNSDSKSNDNNSYTSESNNNSTSQQTISHHE
jgi:hypothetical protein